MYEEEIVVALKMYGEAVYNTAFDCAQLTLKIVGMRVAYSDSPVVGYAGGMRAVITSILGATDEQCNAVMDQAWKEGWGAGLAAK